MKHILLIAVLIFISSVSLTKAQYIEDALRYVNSNTFPNQRAAGLGVSYIGISDDFASLFINPAGLSLVANDEFSMGLNLSRNTATTNFTTNSLTESSSYFQPTHLGFVAPIVGTKSSVAIGYMLENTFNSLYQYSNNTDSARIATTPSIVPQLVTGNPEFANALALAYFDSTNQRYGTPLLRGMVQQGDIRERGAIHAISGGGGWSIAENVSLGLSIVGKFGSYSYANSFLERDAYNIHTVYDPNIGATTTDIRQIGINQTIDQSILGIGAVLGLQSRYGENVRFNLTVKTPTYYSIEEDWSQEFTSEFDNNDRFSRNSLGKNSYNITTPFVFGAGISVHVLGITFTAGGEYVDVTQLEFGDAATDGLDQFLGSKSSFSRYIEAKNLEIRRQLVNQTTWGFGAEYAVPASPFVVRASMQSTSSPYTLDVPGAAMSVFALGGAVEIAPNVRLEGAVRFLSFAERRSFFDTFSYTLNNTPKQITLGLSYRN
ncbi:MAG: hypothetical protein JNL36_06400 [Candidatus Kapabacteria bacterium]|nr:hypothetical protein [Candidatus Kapabacteria bacterium]